MLKPVCIKVGLTLFAGACLCGGIQAHSLNGEKEDILNTMKSATRYMMDSVSYRGGFVWNYLPDLSRCGEKWRRKGQWSGFNLPELRVLVICYWIPITLLVMSFTMKQPKKLLMS